MTLYDFKGTHLRITVDLAKVDAIQETYPAWQNVRSYEFCVGPLKFKVMPEDIIEQGNPNFEHFVELVKQSKYPNLHQEPTG